MANHHMKDWREKEALRRAEQAERRKTCDHVDKGTRGTQGCIGGTWRTYCSWCDELLHDTLWDWADHG